jgi:hypothetical protein
VRVAFRKDCAHTWGGVPKCSSNRAAAAQAPVAGTRARRIPEVYQWTPDMLVAAMAGRGRRLGLVIDLTFTSKHYDADKAFRKPHSIEHVKLQSRGHGEVPTPQTVSAFFWTVRRWTLLFQQQWPAVRAAIVLLTA